MEKSGMTSLTKPLAPYNSSVIFSIVSNISCPNKTHVTPVHTKTNNVTRNILKKKAVHAYFAFFFIQGTKILLRNVQEYHTYIAVNIEIKSKIMLPTKTAHKDFRLGYKYQFQGRHYFISSDYRTVGICACEKSASEIR